VRRAGETLSVGWGGAGALDVRVLASWPERLVGLLGTDGTAGAVLLVGCSSIHTFGMSYPIDVAFVDGAGRVVLARRALDPGRLLGCRGARHAMERPAAAGEWPGEGDVLVALGCRGVPTAEPGIGLSAFRRAGREGRGTDG